MKDNLTKILHTLLKLLHQIKVYLIKKYKFFLALPDDQRRVRVLLILSGTLLLLALINSLITTKAQYCIENGGKWIVESKECENISDQVCKKMKGSYNNCADPYRNDKAKICIQKCVRVCKIN